MFCDDYHCVNSNVFKYKMERFPADISIAKTKGFR